MILGTGVDMCEIAVIADAVERRGDRFLRGVFTPAERAAGRELVDAAPHFARLFAAKEACAKALGVGFGVDLAWRDLEFLPDAAGGPQAILSGGARTVLARLASGQRAAVRVSWRQDAAYAMALVVIDASPA